VKFKAAIRCEHRLSRQPPSDRIHLRPRLARSHDSWRNWWFGYIIRPNPATPGESHYQRLDILFPRYGPFASATAAAENLRELFVRSAELVPRYGLDGVAEGLWNVAHPRTVEYASSLWDVAADDDDAERAIRAIPTLFRDLFAVHCDPAMSSGGSETTNPMNGTCYMWFDLIGLDHVYANPLPPHRLRAMIDVLDEVLAIPHVACRESALHGLGHIASADAALAAPPIRRFLRRTDLPEKLRQYALAAAAGAVQ